MDLLTIAQRVGAAYANHPDVVAIIIAGSVSKGLQDKYSDIEMHVFWQKSITDKIRREIPHDFLEKWISFHPYEDGEWSESYQAYGIKMELSHFLTVTIDEWVADVGNGDITEEKQFVISSVQMGIVLKGEEVIQNWRMDIQMYPSVLRDHMFEEYAVFSGRWLQRYALLERGDFLMLQAVTVDALVCLLNILHAINGCFVSHPLHKWLHFTVERLVIKPDRLEERIHQILQFPSAETIQQLEALVQEVVDLGKGQFPTQPWDQWQSDLLDARNK